jgi:hypothetical protein
MTYELPKFVYPCGIKYAVVLDHMDGSDYGEIDGHAKLIRINSDPKKSGSNDRALFHEFIHGVFHSTGLTQIMHGSSGDLEEAVVQAMEEHLFRLIKVSRLGKKPELEEEA